MEKEDKKKRLFKYNLHMGNTFTVFSSNSKKKIWEEIGKSWAPYWVLDSKGFTIPEFIPF